MAKNKKQKKQKSDDLQKSLIDLKKLKSFGITKDPDSDEIEEITGEEIKGGKDTDPTTTAVCQQWPTTVGRVDN